VRASKEHAEKATKYSERKAKLKRAKGKAKAVALPHLSKKAKKALKETKEIQAELWEAEAEVDREEVAVQVCNALSSVFDNSLFQLANGNTEAYLCPLL